MKVLFVTSSYPSHQDDPRGIHVHRLALALRALGVDIDVLAPGSPGAAARADLDGVPVQRVAYWFRGQQTITSSLAGIVPAIRERPHRALLVPPLLAALTVATMRVAGRYDLVHAHWLYPAGLAAVLAPKAGPVAITAHGSDVNLTKRSSLLARVARYVAVRAALVTTVSQSLAHDLAQLAPQSSVAFIPLGTELRDIAAPPPAAGRLKLVYVGSLVDNKSVHTVIEAMSLLPHDGVELAVVGDGPSRASLSELARSKNVPVTFQGFQPPAAVHACLASSHALVLPSRSEGRPVVVLEAMASSRAVIATDVPGTRELVVDDETGRLFPVGDFQALAAILRDLGEKPRLISSLGSAGRRRIVDLGLDMDSAARRHRIAYQSVVAGAGAT